MAILCVDLARYPVVSCGLSSGQGGELEAQCARYEALVTEQSGDFVVVHDWICAEGVSPDDRRLVFERVVRNAELAPRCLGHFVVTGSPLVRGSVSALLWMQRSSYPVRVTSSLETAFAWAAQQLCPPPVDYLSRVASAYARRAHTGA